MPEQPSPERIIERARIAEGAPYLHRGQTMEGFDQLGLIGFVTEREIPDGRRADRSPFEPDRYDEAFDAAGFQRIAFAEIRPGDIILFNIHALAPARENKAAVHIAVIYLGNDRMIYAWAGRGVVDAWLNRFWRERMIAAFRVGEAAAAG